MPTPSTGTIIGPRPNSNSPLSPLSPTPSVELSSPETIQFALPSDIEAERSDSDDNKQKDKPNVGEKWNEAEQGLEGGYASDSPSGPRTKNPRRMLPPLLMLNHKRSSSSSLVQRPTSVSSSTSPLSSHSRFHSQSSMAALARDSFIDLEDTYEEGGMVDSPNAMYPTPPKRNVGGLFRHKQAGSLRSIASASSLLPTFADPTTNETGYQALAPPSPGLNVPFGVGGAVHTSSSPGTSHTWKMFSRDKDKDKSVKKKDLPWRSSSDDVRTGGANIPSTSSSPTRPSASSLKPPKLKYHKKGKSKSHTHPLDYPSSSSSTPILPSAEPLPLPIPLPLPPTTNNLDPVERQELIKKHRKLAKVLGEEPRVVGHLEFMGGSAFIPGKGAGLSVYSTSTPSNSASHHGTSASMSVSPSGSNSLGTFLHLHRKQKDKDDWESGWEDENRWINKAKGGKGKPQVPFWNVNENGIPETTHLQHSKDEFISVIDGAYQQMIHHNSANPTVSMARRHSTPVTSEFLFNVDPVGDVKRDDRKRNRNQNQNKGGNKARNKRSKDRGDLQHYSSTTRSNPTPSDPILVSPTSPVPSAPTMRSSKVSILESPISGVFPFPSPAQGRESDEASISGDDKILSLHTPLISPSSSTPPILPPLTTSPPRLRIDAALFQNPDPFVTYSSKRTDKHSPSLVVGPEGGVKINTDQEKQKNSALPGCDKTEERKLNPQNQRQARKEDALQVPVLQSIRTQTSKSHTHPHPLVIPLSSKSQSSSRPSTPHTLVKLRDHDHDPVVASGSPATAGSGPASSILSAASASVETLKLNPRTNDKNWDKTRRTPVGPSTFSTPTIISEDRGGQKEKDRKYQHRRTHVRTRSESPESFMDMDDDEIESGSKINIRGNEGDHREKRSQGMPIKARLSSKADFSSVILRSPLSQSPLATMSLSAPALEDSKTKATLDVPSGTSTLSQLMHRTPSLASLTTSIDDLYAYSQDEDSLSLSEQEKRKKMDKIAKLNRFLGDPVPIELVLGDSYVFKDGDLPPLAMTEGVGLVSGSKKPLWMRRRRSSSSAALPGYEGRKDFAESERRKDDLDSKERIKHVRRGAKMEQMFGTRPPPDLYQVHVRGTNRSTSVPNPREHLPGSSVLPASPKSQRQNQSKGNMNSSAYKNKSRHSGLGYSALGHDDNGSAPTGPVVGGIDYAYVNAHPQAFESSLSLGRAQSKSKGKTYTPLPLLFTPPDQVTLGFDVSPSQRPSTGDSDKPLLAFGQDIPIGGRLEDQDDTIDHNHLDPDSRSVKSSVYMYYRQSLISLGDIVEKDDKASLAELHQYLQLPHSSSRTGLGYGYDFGYEDREYDSEDSYDEDEDEENDYKDKSPENKYQNDTLATPTQLTPSGSRSPNTPRSANTEPSHSPSLTRRRSLPSRASTLSLVSTLSGTSALSSLSALSNATTAGSARGLTNIPGYYNAPRTEAEGRAAVFKARRLRAAKLTNFFGVKYRDLFGEVLETIEAGMREDVRAGRMGIGELEELMMRMKKLKTRTRRNEFN
ncbi:hypothetical protein Clacol_004276 [Clathrus columnatus]|uniref:Uncharacterized protein n=1 Tax=Clathrus columnatus TaxID=1419009 RepID=A0AAV5A6Z1_9AGAM|nr:hypothetical protein Clacol_004276 [Clathrus columnatus]